MITLILFLAAFACLFYGIKTNDSMYDIIGIVICILAFISLNFMDDSAETQAQQDYLSSVYVQEDYGK